MMNKIITKSVYHLYDLLNRKKLSKKYLEVKQAHRQNAVINNSRLGSFLKKWNFNEEIEKNPLMTKHDIHEYTQNGTFHNLDSFAYTGGSYGEPLKIPYSRDRAIIRTATFKYYNELGGYDLGDPFVLIRAKDKSQIIKFLRNETVFIPMDISEKKISELVRTLINKRIKVIMGYPTVIYEIALYLERNSEIANQLYVKSLISVSEPLEDYKRNVIHKVFKCSFIDRYSNEEVGLIAQQRSFDSQYFVNKYGIYTEIVDPKTLHPVNEGEQGKVVVTDLYNDLIPIVRYDTGDLAVAHEYKDGRLISLANITGRVTEQIISTAGNAVSPLTLGPYIYKPLSEEGQVYQYQFAQTNKMEYELRIKAQKGQLSHTVLEKICKDLQSILGTGAKVKIQLLKDIKPQPSGKRPVFKNELKN